jgi:hypothetical protein
MSSRCNDNDHVVLLQKIDNVIVAGEALELEKGFLRRIYAIRNLLVVHASNDKNVAEGVKKIISTHRKRILFFGGGITLSILIPFLLITKTSAFLSSPIGCKAFPTKNLIYPGEIEVCLNGITREYSLHNGDVELDITFMRSEKERVQADVIFWIADKIGDKEVDYRGEYNIDRVRIYDNGILVKDDKEKMSGWMHPLVPEDVRMPMWEYVHDMRGRFNRDKKPLEEKIENIIEGLGPIFAAIGSAGLTLFKFIRAGRML